jgi:hypothetical protein
MAWVHHPSPIIQSSVARSRSLEENLAIVVAGGGDNLRQNSFRRCSSLGDLDGGPNPNGSPAPLISWPSVGMTKNSAGSSYVKAKNGHIERIWLQLVQKLQDPCTKIRPRRRAREEKCP